MIALAVPLIQGRTQALGTDPGCAASDGVYALDLNTADRNSMGLQCCAACCVVILVLWL